MRQRARRMAALYDGFRVDHLVGFYRTYGKPHGGAPFFTPADEPSQLAQGEHVLQAFKESGAIVVAEDLGVIPDFVRASMARLGVPGSKVMRWERRWHDEGQPFLDPAEFPAASRPSRARTTRRRWRNGGNTRRQTTEPRRSRCHCFAKSAPGVEITPGVNWTPALRDAILETAFSAGSDDVFMTAAGRVRVARAHQHARDGRTANWTWRLPWPVDQWSRVPEAVERAEWCRRAAVRFGRHGTSPG